MSREKKDGSHHAWITKRSDEAVRPWNFHRVVDEEQSANDFIANLTNKCTYLIGEDVLPKESPSYARFILLNQLNMLSYRGERLPVIYKHAIYEELFMATNAKPRFSKKKTLLNFLTLNSVTISTLLISVAWIYTSTTFSKRSAKLKPLPPQSA